MRLDYGAGTFETTARLPGADVRAALEIWRNGLVNLTGTNRLINFKRTKTGVVEITSPSLDGIVSALQQGGVCDFVGVGDGGGETAEQGVRSPRYGRARPGSSVFFQTTLSDQTMGSVLRRLLKRSKQEYLDRGVSVLYCAAGMLHWRDDDDSTYASPILLLPVELTSLGPRDVPQLSVRDDDPVVNPALTLRLRQMGVELPAVDVLAELDMAGLWSGLEAVIGDRRGWRIDETAFLACFTFHKEAMYRDLLENEQQVLDHPIVRALATKDHLRQTDVFSFEPVTGEDVDELSPPEDIPLLLDADSSQRACIAAAVAGQSFVMDGPPGTGKSQTIANMIGCLLHAGKRVLFVSEKVAALEVVRNRLAEIGLDNYILELHSHKASRKEVATALARALDNVPVPPGGMDPVDRRTVRERRRQLNAFADAMNRVRQPLGYSLHDVLGLCAQLIDAPAAPAAESLPLELTPESLGRVRDAADQLRRAWRPAAQRETFLWRDVVDRHPLDARLYQANDALEGLAGVVAVNAPLAAAFGLRTPGDAVALAALIAHAGGRPPEVCDDWLTMSSLLAVVQAAEDLGGELAAVRRAGNALRSRAGVPWCALPQVADLPRISDLGGLVPDAVSLLPLTAADAEALAHRFADDAVELDRHRQNLDRVTTVLGLPSVVTFSDTARVVAIVELGYRLHKPEPFWFGAGALASAYEAARTLWRSVEVLVAAESQARRHFDEAVLTQPVDELAQRFATVHRGMRKLLASHRRDKKAAAAFALPTVTPAEAVANLGAAVAWKQALHTFAAVEHEHAPALGRYWRRLTTDFGAIHEALHTTDEVLRATPADALPAVIEHVCTSAPNSALIRLVCDARDAFARWQSTLRAPPWPAGRPELGLGAIHDAVIWLQAHVDPLMAAATVVAAFSSATARDLDLAESALIAELRQTAVEADAALASNGAQYTAILGPAFSGSQTDEKALTAAIEWTLAARRWRAGIDAPLSEVQARTLTECRLTAALPAKIAIWQAARQRVIEAFAANRHADIATELDDYASARGFLQELRDDSSGQEEWFSYLAARQVLTEHDLGGAVDFCADQRIAADKIRPVIERALLRSWADAVIRSESCLQPIRAEDRDYLVEEYQLLDRELISGAVGDIITSVNARRPSASAVGEPALIRREGMKKTRHLAVRQLIGQTRNATLALKPCFMMSPLAVSQFLPADIQFDVIIFDEASQVTPADAINCIYRGAALITAGDDKQLPPTSFFDRVVEADEDEDAATDVTDFQSILELSKACGAFRNLGLTWHYRSRHEALIAFSNHAFYGGRLITFPGANAEGPDIGIELIHVDGVYRRGTSRDNPVEAETVAERVLHHYTTRPHLSLGVVTFSVAQADTIEDAVERAVGKRPDLDEFFNDDRLNGFFVKSLESVQGDERDVMIFSIGYGYDELGKISTNFGALNRPKGWRRLNVAITRARQRIEVVSSIRARDIPESTNESVRHLTAYLDFAERGMPALALQLGPDKRDTESPFEDSVLDTIRSWGFTVRPQVGAAGYRIDLGVRHPAHAGEVYAIGVECDGAMYHSSQSARDRDRLREQVLRGLGWNLHRIWGTAWYRHRTEEENKLRAAIEAAVAAPIGGRLSMPAVDRPVITTVGVVLGDGPDWAKPYLKADLETLPTWASPSDYDSRFFVIPAIEKLAAVEGPVHITVALQRMREAWSIGRVGAQIRATIEASIQDAHVHWDGTFITAMAHPTSTVRYPAAGVTRIVEQISDPELQLALKNLVAEGGTVGTEELLTATARLFGWARRGADINARLTLMIHTMITDGRLTQRPEGLTTEDVRR